MSEGQMVQWVLFANGVLGLLAEWQKGIRGALGEEVKILVAKDAPEALSQIGDHLDGLCSVLVTNHLQGAFDFIGFAKNILEGRQVPIIFAGPEEMAAEATVRGASECLWISMDSDELSVYLRKVLGLEA